MMIFIKKLIYGKSGGFSMLELLLYSAIVGILVSIAVPKYNNAVAMANTAKVQADLQSLNTAIAMYQAENGSYPDTITDLFEYVMNVDKLEPPNGAVMLKESGLVNNITDGEYSLTTDKSEATYGGYSIGDFGNKSTSSS